MLRFALCYLVCTLLVLPCNSLTTEELAAFKPRLPDYTDFNTGKKAVVYGKENGDGSQTIFTNGIPSHATWRYPNEASGSPNPIGEVSVEMRIYAEPKMRPLDNPLRCIPLGNIGIATSGAAIDGWFPAVPGCVDVLDFEELDICEGHPSPPPQNWYHYHQYSPCVQMPICGEPSPIYGVAIDGIPIYGPFDEDGRQLTSADLDECGGKEDSTGRYKYHMTVDPNYSTSCLRGEIRGDAGKRPQDFVCTCPYRDNLFSLDKPPAFTDDDYICTFKADRSQPIVCKDKEFLGNMTYKIPYKWEHKDKEVSLAPCCPKGSDCGDSCKTEGGIKEACTQEKRTVKYLTRVKRDTSSAGGVIAWPLLTLLSLLSVLR